MKQYLRRMIALILVLSILSMTGCGISRDLDKALEALEEEDFDTVLELVEDNDDLAEDKELLRAVKKYLKNLASELEDGELETDEVEEILEDMEDLLDELDDEDLFELAEEVLSSSSNSGNSGNAPTENTAPLATMPPEVEAYTPEYRIALITDFGHIYDQSFNQAVWEGVVTFCETYGFEYSYIQPASNSNESRVAGVMQAIEQGYNVIVLPSYVFGWVVAEVSDQYPDVKFLALDVSKSELLEGGVALKGENYDYNPDNWNLTDYVYMDNVCCVTYQEEVAGYMAGYAAVRMGYTKLGFLGGMAVPPVMRYGYGFMQGIEAAAAEMGIGDVELKYAYGNQFYGDADITSAMETWYANGTEVVMACGGGIYTSVAEAAKKYDGRFIGMDTDQAPFISGSYGVDLTVTSAMKGFDVTVQYLLAEIILYDNWDSLRGQIHDLGIHSTNPEENFVQLPMDSTQWNSGFTQQDYMDLVRNLYYGNWVSDDISQFPSFSQEFIYYGNLK